MLMWRHVAVLCPGMANTLPEMVFIFPVQIERNKV